MDVLAHTAATPAPDGLLGWFTSLMEALGGPGAGLAVLLENLFPPIPSEVILPLAGFTASTGAMTLLSAIIWTTVGAVAGAVVLYYVGAWLGRERVRAIADRMPLVKVSDVDRTEEWFTQHGRKAVFLCRLLPVVRCFISLPAGMHRMSMPVFLTLTAVGSLLWNTALILAGWALGKNWTLIQDYVGVAEKVLIVAVLVGVVLAVVARVRSSRKAVRS